MPNLAISHRRYLLLIPLCLFLSSFQELTVSKTTRLLNDNLEILNGSVKQLIETEHNHTIESEYPQSWTIITNFAKNGNIISQSRREYWEKTGHEIRYSYKYDSKGKKTEAIVNRTYYKTKEIYKYGSDDIIQESRLYWNKNKFQNKVIYKYDKTGNTIESEVNENQRRYRVEYLYDGNSRMIKETETPNGEGNGIEFFLEYKSFDSKGNWLKMVRTSAILYPVPNGKSVRLTDTVTRKITYY